jgi:hypothetical protein
MPHGPDRRGFIILFGTRQMGTSEGRPAVETRCPSCGQTARFEGKSYRTWFTLFFIPVFPISGATRVSQCTRCGTVFNLPIEQLRGAAATSGQNQYHEAIKLYNLLRDNPTDSVLLFQVMNMYASMGEFGQAVSAARQFPQALASSSQCRDLLARIEATPRPAEQA